MTTDNHNLTVFEALCDKVEKWLDGGKEVVYLQGLKFRSDGQTRKMDALLYPHKYGGYETRLFLEEAIPSKGQNWKTFNVCGRAWRACSFNKVPASLPWMEILAQHLRILA